jgi:adenosylcobinamide kinase/adenosylcobinamide-phosphate guanylyltransferase
VKEIVFVIGGCRSGKSTYALQTAEKVLAEQKIFIATCVPQDDEMKRRVARHQKERSQNWVTVEAPLALAGGHSTKQPQGGCYSGRLPDPMGE